jgi:hypothetical protein
MNKGDLVRIGVDVFVEQVLEGAGMPLLRIKNKGFFDAAEIVAEVKGKLG